MLNVNVSLWTGSVGLTMDCYLHGPGWMDVRSGVACLSVCGACVKKSKLKAGQVEVQCLPVASTGYVFASTRSGYAEARC